MEYLVFLNSLSNRIGFLVTGKLYFFISFDDKVATTIIGTLVFLCHLGMRVFEESTISASEHNWHSSNGQTVADDTLVVPM